MNTHNKKAFTMIEVVASLSVVSIFILSMCNVIADSYSVWNNIYESTFGSVSQGVINTQRNFNYYCRRASLRDVDISEDKDEAILYFYSDHNSPSYFPDRYARYYLDGGMLKLEIAELNHASKTKKSTISTQDLCENVTYLSFSEQSLSIQMCMRINDGTREKTFAWAAVRHN